MTFDVALALIVIALATFLMRAIPVIWLQRRLRGQTDERRVDSIPTWLSVLGPLMIAAMLGVSLVPEPVSLALSFATLVGALVTLLVWFWRKSLGWPVFAGVASYAVVMLLL